MKVKPALPPRIHRACVPGDTEGLQLSPVEWDQVLLEGIDAERVGDLELARLTVGARCVDEEAIVATFELEELALVSEGGVGEISEHRIGARHLHGEVMVRAAPVPCLLGVAARTDRYADVVEGRRPLDRGCVGWRRGGRLVAGEARDEHGQERAVEVPPPVG